MFIANFDYLWTKMEIMHNFVSESWNHEDYYKLKSYFVDINKHEDRYS